MARTVLIVTDVQERLFSVMDAERRDEMVRNVKILLTAARRLDVGVIVTEQYPRGLGRTLPEVQALVATPAVEKVTFSSCGAEGFVDRLRELEVGEVVIAGVEAHVCVLLTALDLLKLGFHVSVVADAVCARRAMNTEVGLAQARQAGAVVTATETVVFRWLERADTEVFREVAKLLR